MEKVVQSFNLGKSTVVTIPKAFGVKPGTKIKFSKRRDQIVLKSQNESEDRVALVRKLAGGMNFKKVLGKELTPKELNNIFDEQYKELLP